MKILLFALCALLCSCSQNKEKDAETALSEQIHQDYVEMKKYHSTILKEKDRTVDVYVRKGEKITDMTVLSDESNCVSVVFDNYRRVYNIFFSKSQPDMSRPSAVSSSKFRLSMYSPSLRTFSKSVFSMFCSVS